MKKFLIYTCLIFVACQSSSSSQQNISENKIVTNIDSSKTTEIVSNDELTQFIPKGFRKYGEYAGDLNLDSLQDKLLIIEVNDSLFDSTALSHIFPETFNFKMRPLLILIRESDGSLKQVDRNDLATQYLYKHFDNTEEPFGGITINKGFFRMNFIYYYGIGGLGTEINVDFKFSKKQNDWFLSKIYQSWRGEQDTDGSWKQEEETKTAKNFGEIRFKDYKGLEDWYSNTQD